MDAPDEIETERLYLRRSRPEDAEAISAYRSHPDVRVHQGWDRTDPAGIRAEIEEMLTRRPGEPGGWVQFTVFERDAGTLAGDVGMAPADGEPGVIKIGYTIAPSFQGKGYATEATRALVDLAFDGLGADVIRAYAGAQNSSSIRVMEKLGLQLIERFEGADEDGHWVGVRYELRRDA
jgi:RimJ/RimL family protein N-acetyltransferase